MAVKAKRDPNAGDAKRGGPGPEIYRDWLLRGTTYCFQIGEEIRILEIRGETRQEIAERKADPNLAPISMQMMTEMMQVLAKTCGFVADNESPDENDD